MERDAAFAQKKAERACLRVHLREKYRLPKVSLQFVTSPTSVAVFRAGSARAELWKQPTAFVSKIPAAAQYRTQGGHSYGFS